MAAVFEARAGHEVIRAEAVGPNAIRVRLARHRVRLGGQGAFPEMSSPREAATPPPLDDAVPADPAAASGHPAATPRALDDAVPADPAAACASAERAASDSIHCADPMAVAEAGAQGEASGAAATSRGADGIVQWDGEHGSLTRGRLRLEVWRENAGWEPALGLRFTDAETGRELLAEHRIHYSWPAAHLLEGDGSGVNRCVQEFKANLGERLHGLGGRPSGRLELGGQAFDLIQRNGEVTIPVVMSSAGYGFIWNHPGTGRVDFGATATRWTADQAAQIDYVVFWGQTPADRLRAYADLTGRPPLMPEWALGLWQSHLRYTHQDQILAVAREYAERGLPLSVIVSDGGHWTAMGDFRFDPAEYPDPEGLVGALAELGCELMVSVWPTVSPLAESYPEWRDDGLLVASEQGGAFPTMMGDKLAGQPIPLALIDSTNPAARRRLWSKIEQGYHRLGIKLFWLDADEPERLPGNSRNLSFWAGPGEQVVNRYPLDHARALADAAPGLVLLSRSAWLGQQALGCAVWSGDIPATWDSLARQVKVGLQMAMSGIPWWTSDIGGFFGGDPADPDYQELFIRWFWYGAHCPLFRVHGIREPRRAPDVGGPAEIWAFGETAYPILAAAIARRQALRPYLAELAAEATRTGLAPMRPLFVDFADDPAAWEVEDQYMLGPRYLVAPVVAAGARERSVYLPAGASWAGAGQRHAGGQRVTVPAPLESIPVFRRLNQNP